MKQVWQKLFLITFPLTTFGSLAPITSLKAQITPDNTLGTENSVVNGNLTIRGIPSEQIDGGARRGNSLFHSFQEFNVGAQRGAYFSNPAGVDNILTRVTGSNASNILGRLGVLGNANLFLLNPNGILFGQNASLDVRGSFFASTASSLIFNNGFEFSAVNPQAPPLLTVNIPIGLRFRDNPGSITNRSIAVDTNNNPVGLMIPSGNTLALLGGDVSLDGGRLTASGGRVELGGLAGSGILGLNVDGNTMSLSFPDGVARASVSLKNSSNVNVSGNSGSIAINARNLDLQQSNLMANISQSDGTPSLRAGDITVNATETITLGQSSRIRSSISSTGNGSNINITTGSLSIMNGSQVNTFTTGQGNAGNVNINARDNLKFDGASNDSTASGIVSTAQQQSTGNAGNININTGTLSLTNGAVLNSSTTGMGNAGNVTIDARDHVSFNQGRVFTTANRTATGNSGDVSITSGDISLANGSVINLSNTGQGNAGNALFTSGSLSLTDRSVLRLITEGQGRTGSVTINASDRVSLDGADGIYTSANSSMNSRGNNGGISITTGTLSITNGAQLNTSTSGMGNAGDVTIKARDRVSLNNGRIIASANDTATGNGGDIRITSGDISLANGSFVNLSNVGQGNAGNLNINTGTLSLTNGAQVNANSSNNGRGLTGSVTINARDSVSLDGANGIFASANSTNSRGNNGGISITTGTLSITNGAQLNTSTSGMGNAGDVTIDARDRVSLNHGMIITSANRTATGKGGDVSITSGDISLANRSLIVLSTAGQGNAGNALFTARSLSLIDGSQLTLTTVGQGDAGNAFLTTRLLSLTDSSRLTASSRRGNSPGNSSVLGNGGNIKLQIGDLLLLRGQSLISTSADSNAFAGNSGNITINAPLIVAFPLNNDITANASRGSGGQVTIKTQGLFGIAPLSRAELQRRLNTIDPNQLNPNNLPTSDITAISQQSPSLNGRVDINSSYADPSQSLVELPEKIIDPTTQIAQNPCQHGAGSTFAFTGRGGIPYNPHQTLASDNVRVGLVTPASSKKTINRIENTPLPQPTVKKAVPAQGWVFNEKGQVVLTAYDPTKTGSQRPWRTPASCPKR